MQQSTATARRAPVRTVLVVVPAHDEQALVGRLLDSLTRSLDRTAEDAGGLSVRTVVVLDDCTDATGDVVAERGYASLRCTDRCVGAARAAGVAHLLGGLSVARLEETLVLSTDADCVLPPAWVLDHVAAAADADVVLGRVVPRREDLDEVTWAAWQDRHPVGRWSVHGASLGIRLPTYLTAGGFPARPVHEDALLVRRALAAGAVRAHGPVVETSGRRDGRTSAGFAGYLRDLDARLDARLDAGLDAGREPADPRREVVA